ncbi:MAG: SMP-30/gluconolactonase/LRE family protein [Gammaproteobacteria bacterium]|nr:SMP-30/gluconolactonase/LRE family protein [Gammaproteobacteria bacterium]
MQVRVTGKTAGVSEAVFTNRQGRYELVTRLEGDLAVRARLPYYRDATSSVEVAGRVRVQEDFTLQPMTDPVEISNSLPAAYHFGRLPFETGEDKEFNRWQFQRDCLSCHSLGDPFTRIPRSAEAWVATIERMHRMVGNFDAALRDRRAVILAAGFTGEPLSVRPEFPVDPALEKAKIYEFPLARAYVPHDAIAHPNGLLYTVDQGLDHIVITDPVTGESRYVPQTDGRAMEYREGFTTADQEVLGEFNPGSRHGPHSLDLAADGKYYVTNTASRSIGVFNPETEQWEPSFVIAEETGAVYPHTIRADSKGDLWFTLAGSEHVGRLNPASGRFDIVDLPHAVSGGVSAGTQPYGVDINPLDDTMWYGRLFADRIGTVDPQTLEVTEYESPVRGPRRMRFDEEGILWVTGFSAGRIARIDVRNGFASKVYDMPEFAPGYRPTPYALGVHPDTQDIWVNEVMTDRIYRFIPAEERWVAYPVPLAGTYSRDMTFTRNGRVCLSNNPIPPPVLEGGVLEVLCIDPAYDPTVEAAVALGQR